MTKQIREIKAKVVNTGVNVYIDLPRIPEFKHEEKLEYAETQDGGAVIVKDDFAGVCEEVLQAKVLPCLYRAMDYLERDQYDSAYEEVNDAVAIIANRILRELSLQDLDAIRVLAWADRKR